MRKQSYTHLHAKVNECNLARPINPEEETDIDQKTKERRDCWWASNAVSTTRLERSKMKLWLFSIKGQKILLTKFLQSPSQAQTSQSYKSHLFIEPHYQAPRDPYQIQFGYEGREHPFLGDCWVLLSTVSSRFTEQQPSPFSCKQPLPSAVMSPVNPTRWAPRSKIIKTLSLRAKIGMKGGELWR